MRVPGAQFLAQIPRLPKLPALLVLVGPERYTKEKIVARLLARGVAEGTEDFNVARFRGSEVRWAGIVDAASTMPMMSDYRLLLVSDVQGAREREADAVLEYAKDPSPSTCLVVDAEGSDQRRQPLASLLRQATVVDCAALSPRDAEAFAAGYAKERGITLPRQAAILLVERVGTDMTWLSGEVDRLILLVHPQKSIKSEDVARAVGRSRQLSVFEYVGALSRRDMSAAVERLRDLVADGEAPLGILALIERQFRMMLAAAEARAAGAPPKEACRAAGVPPYVEARFAEELTSWPLATLRSAYPRFLRKDIEMKSRGVSALTELELLTAELLTL